MKLFICHYCNSERKNHNSWINHERCCSHNPEQYIICKTYTIGKKGSNQFSKARELGLPVPISKCKGRPGKSIPHTAETKEKLSKIATANGLGGVRPSKRITYKGKTLGSTYELSVVISLDENNIVWDVCKRIPYIDPLGKKRTYTPDIYLVEYNVYLDPKNDFLINNINPSLGFSDKDKIKLVEEQNKIKVLILNKNQLGWETIKTLL